MNKSSVLRNGGIFLLSMTAILISILFLGKDNLMVGANAVFLLVGILNKNFSNAPIKSIIKVSVLMMFIGALPFFVNINVYSGLFINFIGIFILLYAIVYNLNKSIYYPFLFGYTLLLTSNVEGKELLYRVLALGFLGIIAVLFQLFYSKVCEKNPMSGLKRSLDFLITYIDDNDIKNSNKNLEAFKQVNASWSRELLEYKGRSFYLNYKENLELNLIALLDKLEDINSKIINKDIYYNINNIEEIHKDLRDILKNIRSFIYGNISEEKLEYYIINYLEKYKDKNNIYIFEIASTVETFKKLVVDLWQIEQGELKVKKKLRYKDIKESIKLIKEDFNTKSVRFVFSFRTALIISIIYFIVEYYHIEYGKWIIFTIASVSQPYNETVRNRAKERILGTLIGGAIYYILSLIFVHEFERIIIILIAVYLYIHFKKYMQNVIMITVMFLGLATVNITNATVATEWRIVFILIGSLVVLLGNKYIFPYNLKKETVVLLEKYIKCCDEAFRSVVNIYDNKDEREKIKNIILHGRALENKIILNKLLVNNTEIMNLMDNERIIINSIQNTFNLGEYFDIRLKLNGKIRMKCIKSLIEKQINKEDINLNNYLELSDNNSEKLIYKNMYEMARAKRDIIDIEKDLDIKLTLNK